MYDITLGGGLLIMYLQKPEINDHRIVQRGKIPPPRPRSFHRRSGTVAVAEELIFQHQNCTASWNRLGKRSPWIKPVSGNTAHARADRNLGVYIIRESIFPPRAAREQAYAWTQTLTKAIGFWVGVCVSVVYDCWTLQFIISVVCVCVCLRVCVFAPPGRC